MGEKQSSNMALKVIIAIVVIVILVYLFKGMGKGQMAQQPAKTPPQGATTPGTQQPTTPGTAAGQQTTTAPTAPAKPAEKSAETIKKSGVELMSNVKCDYASKTVTFTLTNIVEKAPLSVYQGELNVLAPQTPDANVVKFAINNRRYPQARLNWTVDCGGKNSIDPKASTTCTIQNVVLRDPNQVDRITGMKGQNVVSATNVNLAFKSTNQEVLFTC